MTLIQSWSLGSQRMKGEAGSDAPIIFNCTFIMIQMHPGGNKSSLSISSSGRLNDDLLFPNKTITFVDFLQ